MIQSDKLAYLTDLSGSRGRTSGVLWGFLGNDWGRSWIAVFVGVMLSVIVNIIFKDGSKK